MSVNEKMTAIADAIREKTGGTELLGLDAMAQAIAGLETGGGLPEGISALAYGYFTCSADSNFNAQTITHNLGVEPNFFVLLTNNPLDLSASYIVWALGMRGGSTKTRNISYTYRSGADSFYTNNFKNSVYAPTTTTWQIGYADTTHKYKAGQEYMWICGVWDNYV